MFKQQMMNPAKTVFLLKILIKIISGKAVDTLAKPLSFSETSRCFYFHLNGNVLWRLYLHFDK